MEFTVVLGIGLLLAAMALLRRAAGRIFAFGMLIYRKEPSWRETLRWARES